ncbi:hypothetical protein M5K25_016737 [Dendrobium thyrsiflorum]|uniref:Uncharacterized protein n=1 Tax=Dendrobium thyrsiflorum TaxID=117978 RepID=A0ABD0UKJ9_DENTH
MEIWGRWKGEDEAVTRYVSLGRPRPVNRTERLRNTNPTTPNSTQSELKWVQIKDPKHVWKVRTIIWITKQFQNVTCLYSNRAARRDESNKPKIIKF